MDGYTTRLINLAVDLINTYDPYLKEPEGLKTPADLAVFMQERGIEVLSSLSLADLRNIRAWRSQLWEALNAAELEGTLNMLNRLLEEGSAIKLRLNTDDNDNNALHLEYDLPQSTPPTSRLKLESVTGLGLAIKHFGMARLKSCQARPCQEVFIDTSKNGLRRFCSDRCANRYNIAAFRGRKQL